LFRQKTLGVPKCLVREKVDVRTVSKQTAGPTSLILHIILHYVRNSSNFITPEQFCFLWVFSRFRHFSVNFVVFGESAGEKSECERQPILHLTTITTTKKRDTQLTNFVDRGDLFERKAKKIVQYANTLVMFTPYGAQMGPIAFCRRLYWQG
jgi:hypothetical protein